MNKLDVATIETAKQMPQKLLANMVADALAYKMKYESPSLTVENGQLGGYRSMASFDATPHPGGVNYYRHNRRVERWDGITRTHVFRAKLTRERWDIIVELAWWYAREIMESRPLNIAPKFKIGGRAQLINELRIDRYDWNDAQYLPEYDILRVIDSEDDNAAYFWHHSGVHRIENGNTTNVFLAITLEEWKKFVKEIMGVETS